MTPMNNVIRNSCSALAVAFGLTGLAASAQAALGDEIAAAFANDEVVDLTVTVADIYPAH